MRIDATAIGSLGRKALSDQRSASRSRSTPKDARHIPARAGAHLGPIRDRKHSAEAGHSQSDVVAAEVGAEETSPFGGMRFMHHTQETSARSPA